MKDVVKEVINVWKSSLPGKAVPIPSYENSNLRVECYLDLFETALYYGVSPETIKSPVFKAAVSHISYNSNHPNVNKASTWRKLAEIDYDCALARHPQLTSLEVKKFGSSS